MFKSFKSTAITRTDTGSRVCGNYILIFREWKRSIDRLTEKNTARWIDGQIDRFKIFKKLGVAWWWKLKRHRSNKKSKNNNKNNKNNNNSSNY